MLWVNENFFNELSLIFQDDLPEFELYLAPAIISGHNTVMVTKIDDRLMKQYNIRCVIYISGRGGGVLYISVGGNMH
jgi:hypothetical protein